MVQQIIILRSPYCRYKKQEVTSNHHMNKPPESKKATYRAALLFYLRSSIRLKMASASS